jgi:broad specificity phosphatase PhoE
MLSATSRFVLSGLVFSTALGVAAAQADSREATSRPVALRVVFVRHAESEGNVKPFEELDDATKNKLTARGDGQAREAAQKLKTLAPDLFATSPAGRARATAEILARGRAEPPADPAKAATVVDALGPLKDGVGGDGKPFPVRARVAAWRKGEDVRPKDGESLEDVRVRVVAYLRETAKTRTGATLLIVSHGEVGAGLLAEATGTTALSALTTRGFRNASVHAFDVFADGSIAYGGEIPAKAGGAAAASRPESRPAAR